MMPPVANESLREKLRADKGKPAGMLLHTATEIAMPVLRELTRLHNAGSIHGALKPECILLGRDGSVTLAGDGSEGPLVADYASPEEMLGNPQTHLSDIFSFGVVFYEMLTGTRPFLRKDLASTKRAILEEWPPALPSNFGVAVDRIVRSCLRKDPKDRMQSAADLVFCLDAFSGLQMGADRRKIRRKTSAAPAIVTSILALLLGGVGGAFVARQWLRPSIVSSPSFRALTTSGNDSSPSVSTDGKLVAFASSRTGISRIWLLDQTSGVERVLTAGPDLEPRISPDGGSVLFIRGNTLWRTSVNGGEPVRILNNAGFADWSPDGRDIAWSRDASSADALVSAVGVVSADGRDARELTRVPNERLHHPRWSPDGKLVAVAGRSIWMVTPYGSVNRYNITGPTRGTPSAVAWAPDSREIYYLQSYGTQRHIVRQNAKSGASNIIGFCPQAAQVVEILAANQMVLDGNRGVQAIHEVRLKEKTERVVARGASDPAYSPDGVYFASSQGIQEMNARTGATRRVVQDQFDHFEPYYAANRLFWVSDREGHFEIWSANPDGTFPKNVTHDGGDAEEPSASADGNWVVYNSFTPERRGVWKIHQNGIDDLRVVKGETRAPEISPDGRFVLYAEGDTFHVVTIDGQRVPAEIKASAARWMRGGRAIVYASGDSIFVQDFPGSDKPVLIETRADIASLAVSVDGTSLLVGTRDRSTNLIVAENVPGVGLKAAAKSR